MFHPGPPIFGRLVQKLVTDFDEVIFNTDSPGQRKVHFRCQDDRRLLAEVGERHAREQSQVFASHLVSEVTAAANKSDGAFVPSGDRLARHTNGRGAA